MSDIIGASVERIVYQKSITNTWLLGEDLYFGTGAIRDMSNPARLGDYDYYPQRYLGECSLPSGDHIERCIF